MKSNRISGRKTLAHSFVAGGIRVGLLLGLIAFAAQAGSAALVVEWDATEDYTSGIVRYFQMPSFTDTGGVRTWHYSLNTPINPNPTFYSGPEFFGTLEYERSDGTPSGPFDNSVRGDQDGTLRFWVHNKTDTLQTYARGLIFFKPDLQPGQWIDGVSAGNSISITQASSGNNRRFRIALLSDGDWYLSETFSAALSFELNSLHTEMWGLWDPDAAPLNTVPATYATVGSSLGNIEAIGFHFDISETRTGERGVRMSMSKFTADMAVIPEPSAAMLIGLGGLALAALRRRARSR